MEKSTGIPYLDNTRHLLDLYMPVDITSGVSANDIMDADYSLGLLDSLFVNTNEALEPDTSSHYALYQDHITDINSALDSWGTVGDTGYGSAWPEAFDVSNSSSYISSPCYLSTTDSQISLVDTPDTGADIPLFGTDMDSLVNFYTYTSTPMFDGDGTGTSPPPLFLDGQSPVEHLLPLPTLALSHNSCLTLPTHSVPTLCGSAPPLQFQTVAPAALPTLVPLQPALDGGAYSTDVGKQYTCPKCSKEYSSLDRITRHMRIHNKKHVCKQCYNFSASDLRGLYRHKWSRHPAEAKLEGVPEQLKQCDYPGCSYVSRSDNVRRHGKVHRKERISK